MIICSLQSTMTLINILLPINVAMMIFTLWKTITSKSISKDRKTAIYIMIFLFAFVGFIMYFVFKRQSEKEAHPSSKQ